MVTDEELDKTMRESEEILDRTAKLEREVEFIKSQTDELYEKYQIDHDNIKTYLQEGEITPEQKRELEREKEKLDMELEEEIRIAQDRYKMEKMANSGIQKTISRRMRQMI